MFARFPRLPRTPGGAVRLHTRLARTPHPEVPGRGDEPVDGVLHVTGRDLCWEPDVGGEGWCQPLAGVAVVRVVSGWSPRSGSHLDLQVDGVGLVRATVSVRPARRFDLAGPSLRRAALTHAFADLLVARGARDHVATPRRRQTT